MSHEPAQIGTDTRRELSPGAATGPLLLWLGVQLLALALAAFGVPLAANWPRPAEGLAPQIMLAAQISASALLFPYLLRDWRTAALVAASAWPFLLIASVLAAAPLQRGAVAGAYVTAWLVALTVWRAAFPEAGARSVGVAIAAIVSIGSAAVWYLRSEYAQDGSPSGLVALGPNTASMALLSSPTSTGSLWLAPAMLGTCAGALLLARQAARSWRRKPIPTSGASAPP